MRNSITDEITQQYIDNYLEKSGRITYTELQGRKGYCSVLYNDLPNTVVSGYPIASDYLDANGKVYDTTEFNALSDQDKKKCKLRFHYLPYSHELYVGTTGSGKTTGCIEPQLRAISSQKNKPNLFITDPKGELFERNVRHLHQHGYKTYVINFKDITRSDKWNPLDELYTKKISLLALGNNVIMRTGEVDDSLMLNAPREAFKEAYIEYDGRAFPDGKTVELYISYQRDYINAEVDALIDQFVSNIISVQSTKDPTWEQGAQQLLKGIVLCMLEEAVEPNSGFTRDMMTLNTIQRYYQRLRADVVSGRVRIDNHPLMRNKSQRTLIPLRVALNNASNTMMSYCGVFDTATRKWFQGHIFALTASNTIDLEDDCPYAIFVITRDYEKSDFVVAGMFIDWVYRQLLQKAEHSIKTPDGYPSTRPIHFLLDEFGNIPEIPDFENKIATSRSRNIWFHLVVQSYEQIRIVYDRDSRKKSVVICDNCNAQIFLGAQSRDSKKTFSEECGQRWVPSLASTLNPSDTTLTEVAVMPISELDIIKEGEMYIKRLYTPVISSQYIRSYVCAKKGDFEFFDDKKAYNDFSPINIESFNAPKYLFGKLDKIHDDDLDL